MIHYDPHRWFDHFFDIRGSALKEILARVTLCVAFSAAVVWFHKHVFPVGIPSLLHSLTGFAIGLLLVFRTNASYDRFWEGRRLWGGIVNSSRNLVRAGTMHIGDAALVRQLALWTAAFPYATMNTLRGVPGLGAMERDLPAADAGEVGRAQHTALAVAARLSAVLTAARRQGFIGEMAQVSLDQNIEELVDHLGACERIRNTPLPFAYVVHLRRALVLYCFTLPFALVETFGWATVVDVLAVAYIFFGIEEIGVEIEGPFGYDANDLPLEQICERIQHNVYALGGLTPGVPPDPLPEGL